MPRYYFNIHDGADILDKEGIFFNDKREMRLHMVALAARLLEDQAPYRDGTWYMEAIDEEGRIVGSVEFEKRKKEPD